MTRVIKVGGRPQSDPRLAGALASGWDRGTGGLVLVHGGGDEVSTLQAALGGSTTALSVGAARAASPTPASRSRSGMSFPP